MIECKYCTSKDIIKNGFNYQKDSKVQKYKCLGCGKIFSNPGKLPHNNISSEIVGKCFDLYFKGLSYRVIRQQLLEEYKIKISHITIYKWVQRYAEVMDKYLIKFTPKLSAVWQVDETFIKFKGTYGINSKKNVGMWCWVCIDTKTRFVLDMYVSMSKNSEDCHEFFSRIKQKYKIKPGVVCTDGNISYPRAIKEKYPEAVHVLLEQIKLKPNNALIERFNGTIKNRTKTMRGFDAFVACQKTLTVFQIYYNFLRPHMAINNKTPAQEAGINAEFPHRWISIIRQALLVDNNFK